MPKFVKVETNSTVGSYIQRREEVPGCVDAEFDDFADMEPGRSVTLTVVEMTQEEYKALAEFPGW